MTQTWSWNNSRNFGGAKHLRNASWSPDNATQPSVAGSQRSINGHVLFGMNGIFTLLVNHTVATRIICKHIWIRGLNTVLWMSYALWNRKSSGAKGCSSWHCVALHVIFMTISTPKCGFANCIQSHREPTADNNFPRSMIYAQWKSKKGVWWKPCVISSAGRNRAIYSHSWRASCSTNTSACMEPQPTKQGTAGTCRTLSFSRLNL